MATLAIYRITLERIPAISTGSNSFFGTSANWPGEPIVFREPSSVHPLHEHDGQLWLGLCADLDPP